MSKQYDVIIVGGGAAGLLCAAVTAGRGKSVLVAEKMDRPARKLMITGKGRCNLTNNCTAEEFIAAVKTGGKFLYGAYAAFGAQDVMELLESLGVPLKTERGGRVFPQSDKSVDIVDALVRMVKNSGATIATHTCKRLLTDEAGILGIQTGSGKTVFARKVVLATGGASYPLTGSTGDGYALAQSVGHTITPPRPSLIPIVTAESWCREAMGLSLRNVTLTVTPEGKSKAVFQEQGEMLFTHFGVSGPLVLSASAHMDGSLSGYRMAIDLKPALSEQQLDARILRDFGENINRAYLNSLDALLPRKLIPIIVELSGIDGATKVHQITKTQRMGLIQLLKNLPLTPKAFRPIEEAIITSGGVRVSEISPKTMESKLVPGLFFAGELIDVDAYTGGYNLQIAFSTGHLAGMNV